MEFSPLFLIDLSCPTSRTCIMPVCQHPLVLLTLACYIFARTCFDPLRSLVSPTRPVEMLLERVMGLVSHASEFLLEKDRADLLPLPYRKGMMWVCPPTPVELLLESGRGVVRPLIGPIYFLASGERKEVPPYQGVHRELLPSSRLSFWKEKQPMAHHRLSHPKTERDYHLRFNQLKQAITTLKSQIEQETALIQDFKGP